VLLFWYSVIPEAIIKPLSVHNVARGAMGVTRPTVSAQTKTTENAQFGAKYLNHPVQPVFQKQLGS
jgi:hypothetical protein